MPRPRCLLRRQTGSQRNPDYQLQAMKHGRFNAAYPVGWQNRHLDLGTAALQRDPSLTPARYYGSVNRSR